MDTKNAKEQFRNFRLDANVFSVGNLEAPSRWTKCSVPVSWTLQRLQIGAVRLSFPTEMLYQ